jgi:hypothetical protein
MWKFKQRGEREVKGRGEGVMGGEVGKGERRQKEGIERGEEGR